LARNIYFYIALVWTALMFYLCLKEMSGLPKITIPGKDKMAHFAFYTGFVIFWFKANTKNTKNTLKHIVLVGILVGILIEFLQLTCTKTRAFDFFDIIANSLGAAIGYILISKYSSIKS
jgi:VanZ family protein